MILTLEVIGDQAEDLGKGCRKVFDSIGGTIGRLPDNDWVFPDPYVSGRHALIRYVNGNFFVEDTSTNGVFVNSRDNRLSRAHPHQLKNGDCLYIDAYQIQVAIEKPVGANKAEDDPFELLKAHARNARNDLTVALPPKDNDRTEALQRTTDEQAMEWYDADEDDDDDEDEDEEEDDDISVVQSQPVPPVKRTPPPLPERPAPLPREVASVPITPSVPVPTGDSLARSAGAQERPPAVAPAPAVTPPDRSPMDRSPSAAVAGAREQPSAVNAALSERPPVHAPAAHVPAAPAVHATPPVASTAPAAPPAATAKDGTFQSVLTEAGIAGVDPSPELARQVGAMLRVAISGLMEVLRARERMKDDMRLRGTTFKEQHNNPLKFSANVDDAFHNMFVKRNAAYLGPPESLEDAMRDVRDHQASIVAAMRLAFESMLAQFDPARLQEEFDRHTKKGSFLGVPAKLRYWDLYREKYRDIAGDADASFRNLFGEEFAKAYEEQLSRLQALARSRSK